MSDNGFTQDLIVLFTSSIFVSGVTLQVQGQHREFYLEALSDLVAECTSARVRSRDGGGTWGGRGWGDRDRCMPSSTPSSPTPMASSSRSYEDQILWVLNVKTVICLCHSVFLVIFKCDLLVPHGELHHAVKVGECENEVEEGVAVHDTIRFVQLHALSTRKVVTTGARWVSKKKHSNKIAAIRNIKEGKDLRFRSQQQQQTSLWNVQ